MKNDDIDKRKKAGNPIFILIIFIALLGFVFYVPEIYRKYNYNLAEFLGVGLDHKEEKPKDPNADKDAMSDYYQIGSQSSLKFNEITLTDISLSEEKILTFTVIADENLNLTDLNYYLEFYQNRSLFLGRRILRGELEQSKTYSIDVSNMDITTTTYFTVSRIEDSVINPIDMPTDESGIGTLTCNKANVTYIYDFKLGKLLKVVQKYSYTNFDLNGYSDELFSYQKKMKEYNDYNGITASIAESDNSFIYSCEYDYSSIKSFKKVKEDFIFEKDIPNNVIKFKMEAEGYECE